MITPDEDDKDFMTLHVYHMPQVKSSEDGGPAQPKKGEPEQLPSYSVPTERIYFPGDPLVNGVYSNNQHVLSRLDFPPGQHDLILVISQLKRSFTLDYSLDVYSMAPVLLRPVMTHFPHENSIAGKAIFTNAFLPFPFQPSTNPPPLFLFSLPPSSYVR